MCLFTLPSQDQPPELKWTFTFLNDEPDLPEHEVQEPEDTHKKDKPCLILFKTRSVKTHFTMLVSVSQDTICSRHDLFKTHFTMLVLVSHAMSTSPVIEYVAPASAVTYTKLSSDRARGACTCRHPCSEFSKSNTWYLHLLSPTQRLQ